MISIIYNTPIIFVARREDIKDGSLLVHVVKQYNEWKDRASVLLENFDVICMSHSSNSEETSLLVFYKTTTEHSQKLLD